MVIVLQFIKLPHYCVNVYYGNAFSIIMWTGSTHTSFLVCCARDIVSKNVLFREVKLIVWFYRPLWYEHLKRFQFYMWDRITFIFHFIDFCGMESRGFTYNREKIIKPMQSNVCNNEMDFSHFVECGLFL